MIYVCLAVSDELFSRKGVNYFSVEIDGSTVFIQSSLSNNELWHRSA